jgi:hypothetical protein
MSWGATILSLEAWETPGADSCPWVYTWNGSEYVMDNDIYSVARYKAGEYTDFYVLQKPLVADNGSYNLKIQEITAEKSWTDYVGLYAVDHMADVSIGTNEKGEIFSYRPANLIKPFSALSNSGSNVTTLLSTTDNSGFGLYSEDYVEIDFGNVNVTQGARVVLRVRGFMQGTGAERPFIGPPAVVVQIFNGTLWQEIGRLKPRMDWSTGVFDLSAYLPDVNGNRKIRLYSVSHGTKYHEIDFVGLSTGSQPPIALNELTLTSALFNSNSVLNTLSTADENYLQMNPKENFFLSFLSIPKSMPARDFVFVSKGYYIPGNTYYIDTWDGASWVERGSYSYPGSDFTQTFDLSAYLPDPDGQYKVRVRQFGLEGESYCESPASIDFIGLVIDSVPYTLTSATNLEDDSNILSLVSASDDVRFDLSMVGQDLCLSDSRHSIYQWTGGTATAVPVPTMNEWGIIIFMALTGLGAIYYLRKYKRV